METKLGNESSFTSGAAIPDARALNCLISSQTPLQTPERRFIPCLGKTAERHNLVVFNNTVSSH